MIVVVGDQVLFGFSGSTLGLSCQADGASQSGDRHELKEVLEMHRDPRRRRISDTSTRMYSYREVQQYNLNGSYHCLHKLKPSSAKGARNESRVVRGPSETSDSRRGSCVFARLNQHLRHLQDPRCQ